MRQYHYATSGAQGFVPVAVVVDAISSILDEPTRRLVIAALGEKDNRCRWVTKPGGYIDALPS